jgi:hypothetical protein
MGTVPTGVILKLSNFVDLGRYFRDCACSGVQQGFVSPMELQSYWDSEGGFADSATVALRLCHIRETA